MLLHLKALLNMHWNILSPYQAHPALILPMKMRVPTTVPSPSGQPTMLRTTMDAPTTMAATTMRWPSVRRRRLLPSLPQASQEHASPSSGSVSPLWWKEECTMHRDLEEFLGKGAIMFSNQLQFSGELNLRKTLPTSVVVHRL